MTPQQKTAQAALDREQVAFLGDAPSREQITAWFNACLNSACGPMADRYGHEVAEVMLRLWVVTISQKAQAAKGAAA